MITVENIVEKDGKRYLDIRIWSACCKTRFLAEDQGSELLNITTGDYLYKGMVNSVRIAERKYADEMRKMRK